MEIHCKFIAVFKQTILPSNVHDSKFEQRVLIFCKKKRRKKERCMNTLCWDMVGNILLYVDCCKVYYVFGGGTVKLVE